jgi:hypothetical protein
MSKQARDYLAKNDPALSAQIDTAYANTARGQREQAETLVKLRAYECYQTFDDNERTIVRFGMLPASKVQPAEVALLEELASIYGCEILDTRDVGRLFAVGVMDAANGSDKPMVV